MACSAADDLRSRSHSSTDQGASFAASAAVGMLAATASQVAFELAYGWSSRRGAMSAFLCGFVAFAAATVALSFLHWPAIATFILVLGRRTTAKGRPARP
jgi:hypothetical protein